MSTTTPEATAAAHATDTELVLAVSGAGRSQQEVRLRSVRCSIGSGPSCTLRLKARDVSPLHCWVVRGSQRTIVRCCSADTRLNGRSFEEAELAPGDVLSCGPIDLLVVDPGCAARECGSLDRAEADAELAQRLADLLQEREGFEAARRDAEAELCERAAEAERRWDEIRQAEGELQRQREAFEARERELGERGELLDRQIAAFEAECAAQAADRYEADESQLQRAESEAEINARWEQLREAERQFNERRDHFEAQRCQELDQRAADLQAREAELAEREVNLRQALSDLGLAQQELDGQRQEFERSRQLSEGREPGGENSSADDAERRAELEAGVAQLEAARSELDAWEKRLQQQEERLLERRAELQAEREQFYAECEQAVSERPTSPAPSRGPRDDDETPAAPEPVVMPSVASHGGDHDDEAAVIESYMSRLLGKTRTLAAAPVEPAAPKVVEPEPEPVRAAEPAPAAGPRPVRTERVTPPERLTDLNSMRELCNANARHAIDRSQERQQLRAGVQRLVAAVAFAAFGVWLGYMSNLAGSWMYTLGCLSGGFGLVAAIAQGAWLARRRLQRGWESLARATQQSRAALRQKLAKVKQEATLQPETAPAAGLGETASVEAAAPHEPALADDSPPQGDSEAGPVEPCCAADPADAENV